jgi:hypothetical protein
VDAGDRRTFGNLIPWAFGGYQIHKKIKIVAKNKKKNTFFLKKAEPQHKTIAISDGLVTRQHITA